MKKYIATLVFTTVLALAADAPNPTLTTEQKLEAARYQIALIQIGSQFQTVRAAFESADKAYRTFLAGLKLKPGCNLNEKQEIECAPVAAAAPAAKEAK